MVRLERVKMIEQFGKMSVQSSVAAAGLAVHFGIDAAEEPVEWDSGSLSFEVAVVVAEKPGNSAAVAEASQYIVVEEALDRSLLTAVQTHLAAVANRKIVHTESHQGGRCWRRPNKSSN